MQTSAVINKEDCMVFLSLLRATQSRVWRVWNLRPSWFPQQMRGWIRTQDTEAPGVFSELQYGFPSLTLILDTLCWVSLFYPMSLSFLIWEEEVVISVLLPTKSTQMDEKVILNRKNESFHNYFPNKWVVGAGGGNTKSFESEILLLKEIAENLLLRKRGDLEWQVNSSFHWLHLFSGWVLPAEMAECPGGWHRHWAAEKRQWHLCGGGSGCICQGFALSFLNSEHLGREQEWGILISPPGKDDGWQEVVENTATSSPHPVPSNPSPSLPWRRSACCLSPSSSITSLGYHNHTPTLLHTLSFFAPWPHMLPRFRVIPRVSERVIFPACYGISATGEVQTPLWVTCETWQQGEFSQGAKLSQLWAAAEAGQRQY